MNENPNVRFWHWFNDGWVKITIKPGQTINLVEGGPTEEGYHYCCDEFEYDEYDQVIIRRYTEDARDCDGRYGYRKDLYYRVGEQMEPVDYYKNGEYHYLYHEGKQCFRPIWEDGVATQYDEYAEMAGY